MERQQPRSYGQINEYQSQNTYQPQQDAITQQYSIKSKRSGRSLDVCQDGELKGHLIIWDHYGGPNQQFIITHTNNLTTIRSRQTQKFLTVAANSTQNGVPILQQAMNGLEGEKFRLQQTSSGSGQYVIFTFCGKAIDCCEQGTKNGTKIIQWEFHGRDNQKWILQKL